MQKDIFPALIGSGLLYQAVAQQLSQQQQPFLSLTFEELVQSGGEYSLLVAIDDDWQAERHKQLNHYSLTNHIPWLRVGIEFGQGIIGPCTWPWESGCSTCAEKRRTTTIEDNDDYAALQKYRDHDGNMPECSWLTVFLIDILACLVVEEITRFLHQRERSRTHNAFIVLQGKNLQTTIHPFLPDPLCPDCSHLPVDRAEDAILSLQAQQKLAPFTYRVRLLTADLEKLHKLYVDNQAGMIYQVARDQGKFYANVGATIGLYRGEAKELGFGRALSYGASQGAAIAEAMERYAGIQPTGKQTTVRACFNQLDDLALDPTTLGLHTPEQYALPDYPCVPYTHELVCNWVWGYSFLHQQPILVPEHYAYYGIQKSSEPPFVHEVSNGCAVGSCLEEAMLYGILELAERDAFLMTWYARLSAPRIDPRSATDPTSALLLERIEHLTGYSVFAFNITMTQRVPCFWVMAVDEQQRPGYPRTLCAGGSHIHPEKALANAICELAPMIDVRRKSYLQERTQALKMLADSFAVKQMADHALLYTSPEAFDRLSFLFLTEQLHTFKQAFGDFYTRDPSLDLHADLEDLMARYLHSGLDIIVVDQTTPEQRRGEFRCVKVIIPGLLPMTFGHAMRRITGFERLYHPYASSNLMPTCRQQSLADADMNPYPHPFP